MDRVTVSLCVYFEEPFWVGVAERISEGKLSAARIRFGAEPKEYQVMEYLLKNHAGLRFSPAVETVVKRGPVNQKRLAREVRRQQENTGIGTKSQQALKLQQEEQKQERRTVRRIRKDEEQVLRFAMKQQKKKEKHRGR